VVIDTNITPGLAAEGLANDALRFIQDTRKAIGLDVSDRIRLMVAGGAEMTRALKAHERRIKADALAESVGYAVEGWANAEYKTTIEGHDFAIMIQKR